NTSLISDTILDLCGLIFKLVLNPTLGIADVCSNVINIAVFFKMGLGDGVTQNFFILSISDCITSVVAVTNSAAYILQHTFTSAGETIQLEIQRLYWATVFAVSFPLNVSTITTVVIAVVRCCCVAMPLRVKFVLTAPRQLAAILISSAAAIAVLLYVFTPLEAIYLKNPQTNKTYLVYIGYRWTLYTVFCGTIFFTSVITATVCVIILSVNLQRSSKFREKTASGTSNSDQDGRKETRVVKTVVLVTVVFIVCLIPHFLFSAVKIFISEFSQRGKYRNENQLFLMMSETLLLLNANLNVYIYLLFNTRYHVTFMAL
ncbi:hypothetical protein EGW08_010295, partial [Elysia chlorotica]